MKKEDFRCLYLTVITGAFLFMTGCAALLETSEHTSSHFRQVRWGHTKDWVLTKERGKRIHINSREILIYKIRYNGVPSQLVYCFGFDKGVYRLRAAGYLAVIPTHAENPDRNPDRYRREEIVNSPYRDPDSVYRQELLEKLGEPTQALADDSMLWMGSETVVYTNSYRVGGSSVVMLDGTRIDPILPIPSKEGYRAPAYLLIVAGYMDLDFYNEILETGIGPDLYTELSEYKALGTFIQDEDSTTLPLNEDSIPDDLRKEFSEYKLRLDEQKFSTYEKLFFGMLQKVPRVALREDPVGRKYRSTRPGKQRREER
ncbi:MAG: hypothetical protein OXU51_24485 [Candidatus Poribacteria bacterium]|nr:hypothetical protein [Candidatus Poribacteria bacterium]